MSDHPKDLRMPLVAARFSLRLRALGASTNGLPAVASQYTAVADLLDGIGPMADNIRLAIEELRDTATPHNEVADLLATLIGEAPRHG